VSKPVCLRESVVVKSALAGELPEAVSVHVAGCASCREVLATARCMQSLAQSGANDAILRDASWVWSRAQLRQGNAKAARAGFAWESLALISGAAAPVALAAGVAWRWFDIQDVAARLLLGYLPDFAAEAVMLSALVPALLLCAVVSLAYPLLVRD
jgi:hypothetical protein